MFPIKRTVFFTTVTLLKNTVRLIGNIEYIIEVNTLIMYGTFVQNTRVDKKFFIA